MKRPSAYLFGMCSLDLSRGQAAGLGKRTLGFFVDFFIVPPIRAL